jgi:hypothetical protein
MMGMMLSLKALSGFFAAYFFPIIVIASAPSGPWDAFNLAPNSRTVYPAHIHGTSGKVDNAEGLLTKSGVATLHENYSYITLDFGKEACMGVHA